MKKLNGHTAIVNSMQTTRRGVPYLVSGGDDGTTKLWDLRVRRCVHTFEHQYQILAVSFDDTAERIFSGSLDNTVLIYDMRMRDNDPEVLEGHTDSITGLDVSKDGNFLATNATDAGQHLRVTVMPEGCLSSELEGKGESCKQNAENDGQLEEPKAAMVKRMTINDEEEAADIIQKKFKKHQQKEKTSKKKVEERDAKPQGANQREQAKQEVEEPTKQEEEEEPMSRQTDNKKEPKEKCRRSSSSSNGGAAHIIQVPYK